MNQPLIIKESIDDENLLESARQLALKVMKDHDDWQSADELECRQCTEGITNQRKFLLSFFR